MTLRTNSFEGGTDGVAISTSNSGGASGSAFDAIFGTGFTFSAAGAQLGSMGANVATNVFGAGEYTVSTTHLALKIRFKMSAVPTVGDCYLIRVHAGGTRLFDIHTQGTGKIRVDDSTTTTGTFTFANALLANTAYRLEAYLVAGTTTSNGTIKVAYYLGSSLTPVETAYLNTTANLGTAQTFTTAFLGKYTANVEAYSFDDFGIDDAATDLIGIPSTPPTVSTPANQNVAAGASVTSSVTASSSSATISSYAWSYLYPASGGPTLSGTSTNTVSFTAGSAGALYQLQCVVTDSNALTTTVTTEVRVPSSGDVSTLPGAANAASVGTWSNVGGASTPGDAASDSSDSTYLESATLTSSAVSERLRLAPMTARSALSITARLAQDTSGTTTFKVRLFEGATQRQEWTQAVTTTFTDYSLSLTSPGAITDWGNLYIEVVATSP